jgi:hypothetical protein
LSDAPCNAMEAVDRARRMVNNGGQYLLGTGDYRPFTPTKDIRDIVGRDLGLVDLPWTLNNGEQGSDCAGFAICWCWKVKRHRPGFNKGPWASVEDDINVNSIIEDAKHKGELVEGWVGPFEVIQNPRAGDLICYPTFWLYGKQFIGHVAIIEIVPANYKPGRFDLLTVIQCHGPNGFRPGVVRTDGSLFVHHDDVWNDSNDYSRRCKIVRMKERK